MTNQRRVSLIAWEMLLRDWLNFVVLFSQFRFRVLCKVSRFCRADISLFQQGAI